MTLSIMTDQQNLKTAETKPLVTKRSARMLHEGSFATSALTSTRSQSRPPGFVPSSLDFKSAATDTTAVPPVTTKPGNKKYSNNKQQEQLEKEKQYQQQRQFRPGHPTRAQGNFGPPPHSVRSLEDLENMTEEQIYKLFMDDPELHQAFIRATQKEEAKTAPSTAPVGTQNSRSSSRRKPSRSSKSKRSSSTSTSSKKLNPKNDEREFPYIQWLFLLLLVVAALYNVKKAFGIPASKKETGRTLRNRMGKKQKKKQKTGKKYSNTKTVVATKTKVGLRPERDDVKGTEQKSPPRKRKKKKPVKTRVTNDSSSISHEEKGNNRGQKQERQSEPDLETTDASNGTNVPEISKVDLVLQADAGLASALQATNENGDEWRAVTKASKGERKTKTNPVTKKKVTEQIAEKNVSEQPVAEKSMPKEASVDNTRERDVAGEPKNESEKKYAEALDLDTRKTEEPIIKNDKNETREISEPALTLANNEAEEVVNDTEEASKMIDVEKQDTDRNESITTIEDDAALALQLHEEEVIMARAANANPQEEEWEEVTVKKKKGNKV